MSRQQRKRFIPKVAFRSDVSLGRLSETLREQWTTVHPDELGANPHFDRAKNLLDSQFFTGKKAAEPDPVVYQAATRYLELRPNITMEKAQAEGFNSPGRYVGQLIVEELVSPPDDPELLLRVAKGVELAKIALNKTLHR